MNRRNFIQNLGFLSGSFALNFQGISLNASAQNLPLFQTSDSDRVLVMIQLFGGNDGLNTIIPFEDDIYHKSRPTLRKKKNDILSISSELGVNPYMSGFYNLYQQGKVSIVQNVGYENPDRSHFRSTDIWKSASDSDQYIHDGWTGRYLENKFGDGFDNSSFPLAIELGWSGSLLLQSESKSYGLYMNSPEEYYSLISNNSLNEYINISSKAADGLNHINTVARNSFKFSKLIKDVSSVGKNVVAYPDTFLGKQLSIIAKLISGGINTPVFIAKLKGFDTHFNQLGVHDSLLEQVSDAVSAFQKDIENQKFSDKVSTMVFSEFGRRVQENASGTDHGTAAPTLIIGESVRGGVIGKNPNLKDLDKNGDLKFKYDFRQIYSTILKDHLNSPEDTNSSLLFKSFSTLPIYKNSIASFPEQTGIMEQSFPNPVKTSATINYSLTEGYYVRILFYDVEGKVVMSLVNKFQLSGNYSITFDAYHLPAGVYLYRMEGMYETKKMIVEKF